jgi:pyruvate formate lyase activating enzyme
MMAETGIVFDIQRCSLHDGPGIRTTIFLKGCQLACQWCHNPESIAFQPQLSYNPAQCVNCLACVRACDFDAHLIDEQGHHLMDFARCTACGNCVDVCQGNALRMIGSEMTVEAVMKEVLRDRAFYERSGGGITLSGGEPMMQLAFSKALLAASKDAGIHTCLETNGAVPQAWYEEIMPLVDLFLFDYKATDPALHKQLTGSSNEQILENLAFLYEQDKAILLRCPLIPGVNDDTIHLDAIAQLHKEYQRLAGIELMPYHNLGVAKSGHIGEIAPLPVVKAATAEMQEAWLMHLRQAGCEAARIS